VSTVRTECLDWLLIIGRRHLEHVLRIYIQHYTRERPTADFPCSSPYRLGSNYGAAAMSAAVTASAASCTSTTEPRPE
jgi:hypothetical protein